jgi:ribosomal protein S18 acetylase RimI-like enzyme
MELGGVSGLTGVLRDAEQPTVAGLSDLNNVAADLAEAFADYPMCRWIFQDVKKVEAARLRFFQILSEDVGFYNGVIYRPKDGGAAAIWISSDRLHDTTLQNVRILLKLVGVVGLARLQRLITIQRAMNRHHPKIEVHWYLFLIGVQPRFQGKGIGSRLLHAGLTRVDAKAHAAFLETSVETNVPFYARYGFEVVDIYDIAPGSPPTWAMWRPAQRAAHR